MANEKENGWLDNLVRQAGIRRALLVHGEVLDVRYCPQTKDYRTILELVRQALSQRGFDHIVVWDRFAGVAPDATAVWQELSKDATGLAKTPKAGSADYDIGAVTSAPAKGTGGSAACGAEDFLSVICHHMLKPRQGKRCAFVVDWSHYLFGNSNSLTERERQLLLILSKAMRDAALPLDSADAMTKPTNLVVFICGTLGTIPPSLYRSNPAVQDIAIPSPSRPEREALVERYRDCWQLHTALQPGTADFSDFVDALEGMALRDIQQLIRLSRQTTPSLTCEQLVNLYKYGEQKSPWEDLNRAKLSTITDALRARVKGQDEAVEKVARVIIRAYTGLSGLQHSRKQKMPKGVLFFVGPTGVGKTELAKALAQFLFGDEEACIRFDMSEFNHEHSDQRLIGAPPGYVGYEEGGQLTNAVKKRPFSVLLFDEIEKAHVRILDKFLQILEDGRLTDGKGETVFFSETVIIFTSNIGAAEVELTEDVETVKNAFLEKVRAHFVDKAQRPELLSRIGDNIVPFNFITSDDFLVTIARAKIEPVRERLKDKYRITDLVFDDEDKALRAMARSVNRKNGGRGVLNEIVKALIDPLAEFLFQQSDNPITYAKRRIVVHQAADQPLFVFELK